MGFFSVSATVRGRGFSKLIHFRSPSPGGPGVSPSMGVGISRPGYFDSRPRRSVENVIEFDVPSDRGNFLDREGH